MTDTRRGFLGRLLALVGVGVAAKVADAVEVPHQWVPESIPSEPYACYHCNIQGLVDHDMFGKVCWSMPATHVYATADGSWKSYWCDRHAPLGSVKFRDATTPNETSVELEKQWAKGCLSPDEIRRMSLS